MDGRHYHQFREEDDRKERLWRVAGYTVRRVGSDVVYNPPHDFVAACVD